MQTNSQHDALIVVDYQNGFTPVNEWGTGELWVEWWWRLASRINDLIKITKSIWRLTIGTRDWHPANHISFASQHLDRNPFETLDNWQVLWPDHCIANTRSAYYHKDLLMERLDHHIIKWFEMNEEAYSWFEWKEDTPEWRKLINILKDAWIKTIKVVGLATDYCVNATVLDALKNWFNVKVIQDAIAGVNPAESIKKLEALREKWVLIQ